MGTQVLGSVWGLRFDIIQSKRNIGTYWYSLQISARPKSQDSLEFYRKVDDSWCTCRAHRRRHLDILALWVTKNVCYTSQKRNTCIYSSLLGLPTSHNITLQHHIIIRWNKKCLYDSRNFVCVPLTTSCFYPLPIIHPSIYPSILSPTKRIARMTQNLNITWDKKLAFSPFPAFYSILGIHAAEAR